MTNTRSKPAPVICPNLNALGGTIAHGFFTRDGGTSDGIYKGLNVGLGSNDNREHVLENRRRVAGHFNLKPQRLASPYQVHSCDVAILTEEDLPRERKKLDGFVTSVPNIAIGILTADCGPVLFADETAGVVGGCHAGWKGATGNIMEETISKMESLGATRKNIVATLGPTISKENYEVGPEFVERLCGLNDANEAYLSPSKNEHHAMFDLPGYIVNSLERSNVSASWTGHCTYADAERFFSYRRTTHNSEPDYGRQISAIAILN